MTGPQDPPRSLLELADLATPMAVRVAATLRLADHAGDEGATAGQLAAGTGAAVGPLARLLDHLVTVGVFTRSDDGRYTATAVGRQMRRDAPEGIDRLLDIDAIGGRSELAFVELLHSVTSGLPAYEIRYGRPFWQDLGEHPQLRRSFDAQMNWRFRSQADQIAAGFDWGRFPTVLDVGGGDGQVLAAILAAHPGVRGEVLDLPPTAAAAADRFARHDLTERAGAIAGSFFDPLPTGFDGYLLSDVLHDWDERSARTILTRCRDAAGERGTVVVTEALRDRDSGTAMDLHLLMCFGGHERSYDELVELARVCGLVVRSSMRVSNGRTALELVAAPGDGGDGVGGS